MLMSLSIQFWKSYFQSGSGHSVQEGEKEPTVLFSFYINSTLLHLKSSGVVLHVLSETQPSLCGG